MEPSVGWFILQIGVAALMAFVGYRLGQGPRYHAIAGIGLSMSLLLTWSWLTHRPSVALQLIPLSVLRYVEGTAALPLFMLFIGVIWSRSTLPRHRRLAFWATGLAVLYFVNGGIWMMQSTPRESFARGTGDDGIVMQSQEYSCVPAACATALNFIGVPTTEAQMAILTETRPGTGATLLRAMDGLQRRLVEEPGRRLTVELMEPDYDDLRILSTPLVTAIKVETARRHMVVVTRIESDGVWIADPVDGMVFMPNDMFRACYTGKVLTFQ